MSIKSLLTRIKPHVPIWLIPFGVLCYRALMACQCAWVRLREPADPTHPEVGDVPPAGLRYRVSSSPSLEAFAAVGRQCAADLEAAVERHGRKLASLHRILDFGCGCGRTILWMRKMTGKAELHGSDIDAEAIEWCRSHVDGIQFEVNTPEPPTKYAGDHFDFIYGISVLTHLSEEFQFKWLEELRRITRPGGIVVLTVLGPTTWKRTLPPKLAAEAEAKGFLFASFGIMRNRLPDFYQSAYHTEAYVRRGFSRYFSVLEYAPRGLNHHQDMVVLCKDNRELRA